MSALCPHCRKPAELDTNQHERLCGRYPHLRPLLEGAAGGFWRAVGCDHCHGSGYMGDLAVFDLFRNEPEQLEFFTQNSLLSLEEYGLHMARSGQIDLDDLLDLDGDHLRRTYAMLAASEKALTAANLELNRKLVELEASNRVLVQRTEVLMSLQELGQALIRSTGLEEFAARVCRQAAEMCGADRVALYLRQQSVAGKESALVLAAYGWETSGGLKVAPAQVFDGCDLSKPTRFMQPPPGVRPIQSRTSDNPNAMVRMGLRAALVAQDQLVGVMIVQSTHRDHFLPGETALLQTFANQAALGIQRAGLVEELRAKISELEAAQSELVKKERMERELELAREVQQNLLPSNFPQAPGFSIAARNEPARQVGGDFYDWIRLDHTHYGVLIADVADKGMPAALYMALSRSLLLAEAHREYSPLHALRNVNRLLLELGDLNGFVSVFYGVIDITASRMVYTRAGHERPLLLRKNELIQLGGEGAVLGLLSDEELRLTEEELDLLPGDRLVLYTDGLSDATDSNGQFFGAGRLEALLRKQSGREADAICEAVFQALTEYRGQAEPFDDMTLLVLEVA